MRRGTQPIARRGFLRRAALVIGAVLVGVGRTESAHALVDCCGLCKSPSEECRGCKVKLSWTCHHPNYESGPPNRECFECYDTAISGGCLDNGCQHVTCSEIREIGDQSPNRLDREHAWGHLDDLGIGCHDPDTGEYIMWSEPGTPCDTREPTASPPEQF